MRVLIILLSIRYNVCACLHTTTEECEKAYERIEYSLLTGSELASVGTGTPGSVGYMSSDPANYNEAVSGPDAELWKDSMRDEAYNPQAGLKPRSAAATGALRQEEVENLVLVVCE